MSANPKTLVANIYNPHNQSKDELISSFVVRLRLFEKIFKDIQTSTMQNPEQHYIIQGVRGMGKTTLLLRIAYEVENDTSLNKWLIPIVFNEEEYGISSLADVWEKIAFYLENQVADFAGLHGNIVNAYQSSDYERRASDILIKALREKKKKILLIIDNIGDILKKFDEQEEQRLREVLLSIPEIRLIGATPVYLGQFFDYRRPFYDFFKYQYLEGLNQKEALDLMLKLGEAYHAETVKRIVTEEPYRIEVLRRLTGGVTRTMVLLFEIFVENNTGSAFKDLEIILDRVTPLYKHRMDDLLKQQQKIVASLANFWDAASTKELAEAVKMESKVVSAQLKQLTDNQIVRKIETKTKNHLYQLDERFFNIWYLMRFGRKTDQRVLWLVKFLEEFIGGDEVFLKKRVDAHFDAMQAGTLDAKAALYLTEAFGHLVKDFDEQHILILKTREYLLDKAPKLVNELEKSDKEKYEEFARKEDISNEQLITIFESIKRKTEFEFFALASLYFLLHKFDQSKKNFQNCINSIKIDDLTKNEYYLKGIKYEISKKTYHLGFLMCLWGFYRNNYKSIINVVFIEYFFEIALKEKENKIVDYALTLAVYISIWVENYEFGDIILKDLFTREYMKKNDVFFSNSLKLLLAKKQYHTVYNYFQNEEWQLKDRFKPLYYATMYYLQDEYPNEYLRMGSELKETVEEIIEEIKQLSVDYA